MYNLKETNGIVNILLKTGNDYTKGTLPLAIAKDFMKEGKVSDSGREDYPICVDNQWFFEGEKPKFRKSGGNA